jgi:2-polyprenyl-3-methyl-5-hydroxy-6-metoxy-1,4-benzoquinol methylase
VDIVPTPSRVEELYGGEGLAEYFAALGARHELKFRPRIAELRAAGVGEGARILDVGCGSGEFAALAQRAGYDAVGIDISEPSIRAAQTTHRGAEFRVADAETIASREPESFDLVTLWDVLEHVVDPHAVTAACANALRKGGLLAIGTPNGESLYDRLMDIAFRARLSAADRMIEARYSEYHLQIWTVPTLSQLVRGHGLDVVSMRRHRELTAAPSLYVRQAGYRRLGAAARALDPLAERLWPIRNKLTLYARKRG